MNEDEDHPTLDQPRECRAFVMVNDYEGRWVGCGGQTFRPGMCQKCLRSERRAEWITNTVVLAFNAAVIGGIAYALFAAFR